MAAWFGSGDAVAIKSTGGAGKQQQQQQKRATIGNKSSKMRNETHKFSPDCSMLSKAVQSGGKKGERKTHSFNKTTCYKMTPHPRLVAVPGLNRIRPKKVSKQHFNSTPNSDLHTHTGADIGRAVSRNTHSFFLLDVLDRLGGKGVGKKKQTKKQGQRMLGFRFQLAPRLCAVDRKQQAWKPGREILGTGIDFCPHTLVLCCRI